eukprot:5671514-Pleurochrysis_carterae.AAC.1
MPFATSWAMTSDRRWPSRARPTPWPSATATVSQDTESWGMAHIRFRAAQRLLRIPRAFAPTSASSPSPLTASALFRVSGGLALAARLTRTAWGNWSTSFGRSWSPSASRTRTPLAEGCPDRKPLRPPSSGGDQKDDALIDVDKKGTEEGAAKKAEPEENSGNRCSSLG